MQITPKQAPFLDWQPALKAEDVFKSSTAFTFFQSDQASNAYWVEPRPEEAGRSVLVQRQANGRIREITPMPYSVRTRVLEYGSRPYVALVPPWVAIRGIFF